MTHAPPLERPGEIYATFTAADRATLAAFVDDVRRLGKIRFFDQVPSTASINYAPTGVTTVRMQEPDDEAVRAAMTAFRQIYAPKEPTSAKTTLRILKDSVHRRDSSERDAAMAALKDLQVWLKKIEAHGIGLALIFDNGEEQNPYPPARILDAYFHGLYFHSGNAKTELARQLDALGPWGRYTLYTVMWRLTHAYWIVANVAELAIGPAQKLAAV